MGTGYASQLPLLRSTSDRIVAMLQLRTALSFEWYPFSTSHRFPFEAGFRCGLQAVTDRVALVDCTADCFVPPLLAVTG